MEPVDRELLRTLLKAFDEVGLVALANKGLVRRAAKDLQTQALQVEETENALLVRGPDFTVTMPPEGPAKATDDTKATGITRQILMATMFLRDGWAAAQTGDADQTATTQVVDTEALQATILGISHEHLQKWAGKNIWREALFLARSKPRLELETHAGLAIRFVDHEIEARIPPGAGHTPSRLLDAVLTTASKTAHPRWVVAILLTLQQHWGKSIEPVESAIAADNREAPRTRAEILDAVLRLFDTMVTTGLAHPSERLHERLLTLSISVLGVHLPRLGRLLRSLADDVSLLLNRDAKGDVSRLFDRLCFTLALTQAMVKAGPEIPFALAGRPRTEYEPAGDLSLVGMAAFPWQTASGFHGLTLLCWDEQAKTIRSWTTSRALAAPGRFDVRQAYQTEVPWPGGGPTDSLCRSRFVLTGARVNHQGRLSAAQGISVSRCEPAQPKQIDFGTIGFRSWSKLGEHARSLFPLGLRENQPLDTTVVLYPSGWGECVFNELQQRLAWMIADDQGASLSLTLPWAPIFEDAIEFLEQVKPDRDRLVAVVARLLFDPAGLRIEPVALWSEGTPQGDHVLNPAFDVRRIQSKHSTLLDRLRQKYGRNVLATAMELDDDEANLLAPLAQFPAEMEKRFGELENLIATWAERGIGRTRDMDADHLRAISQRFSQAGLDWLAHRVNALPSADSGLTLLWCGYLLRTYRQAQLRELLVGASHEHAGASIA